MPSWLVMFILVDAVITLAVVAVVLGRRKTGAGTSPAAGLFDAPGPAAAPAPAEPADPFKRLFGGGPLRGLAVFAKEQDQRIGDYVRGNWSGVPDQLPAVLTALLNDLERDAQAKGLSFDRETLKSMLAGSLRGHHIGGGHDVLEALAKVS